MKPILPPKPLTTAPPTKATPSASPTPTASPRSPGCSDEVVARRVEETFVAHPNRLVKLSFQTPTGHEELTCTPGHPFYIPALQRFLPAGDLALGTKVALAGHGIAKVVAKEALKAENGDGFTTFNFAVEGTRTYFVGKSALWVHNTGTVCQRLAAGYYDDLADGMTRKEAIQRAESKLQSLVNQKRISKAEYNKHRKDFYDEALGVKIKTPCVFTSKTTWTAPAKGTGLTYKVFRQEIDWDLVVKGKTNAEWASLGRAPYIMKNGRKEQIQLHHSRQNANGPLFEVPKSTHQSRGGHGYEALNPHGGNKHPHFPVNQSTFRKDRKAYWMHRVTEAGRLVEQ